MFLDMLLGLTCETRHSILVNTYESFCYKIQLIGKFRSYEIFIQTDFSDQL